MLVATDRGVAFRHELAREAVERSVAPDRGLALHRAVLAALAAPPDGAPDAERLAHHSEAVGDRDGVLRWAPQAASALPRQARTARPPPSTPARCGSPTGSNRQRSRSCWSGALLSAL